MIQAVIFDMDGLLIDSMPLWEKGEIEIFSTVGISLTPEMIDQTFGLKTNEVVEHWYRRYPWKDPTPKELGDILDARVMKLIKEEGKPKKGVNKAIAICEAENLPMAIASSSSFELINAVTEKLGIKDKIKIVHSAHDEDFGKPHPAVYISTAQELGVHPNNCLAFEDSTNGVLSAKAAKMKCIAVPAPKYLDDRRFHIADLVIDSLADLTPEMLKKID